MGFYIIVSYGPGRGEIKDKRGANLAVKLPQFKFFKCWLLIRCN